jgi:hypothetical protein
LTVYRHEQSPDRSGSAGNAGAGSGSGHQHLVDRCSYRLRLAPEGVTVNAVALGLIDTKIASRCSSTTRFMTGQTVAVNGGSLFS